ncbi:MAG: tetratricopeptide repeat protein [Elusimicrobiota bacterium]|nr:tetratricopeptide repeat protein [Elusimicrobiota bacterium]
MTRIEETSLPKKEITQPESKMQLIGKPIMSVEEKLAKMREDFRLATELYKNGQYKEAIAEWEKVLEIDPNHELSKEKIRKAKEKLGE